MQTSYGNTSNNGLGGGGAQTFDAERSDIVKTKSTFGEQNASTPLDFMEKIRFKQREQVPMAHFSREERAFMAVRNHRMIQNKRKANELNKTMQLQALPDNTKVR